MKKSYIVCFSILILLSLYSKSHAANYYYLNMNNNISIAGAISPAAGQTGYPGESLPGFTGYASQTLYALPPAGYVFVNWTGTAGSLQGVADTAAWKITVTMDRNRTITANFVPAKHITINTRGYIHASPLLYDINHDGFKEIIIGDMAGYVYCFDHLGNKLWEYYAGDAFDKTVSPIPDWFNPEVKNNNSVGNVTIQSSCAAGDIDGDGIPDIICGVGGFVDAGSGGANGTTTGFGPVGQGGILILNADGTLKMLIRGWDTFDGLGNAIQDGFSDGVFSTPGLADFDNDGRLDFVVGGTDQNIYGYKIGFKDTTFDSNGNKIRFFHPPGKDGLWAIPLNEVDDDGDGKYNEDPIGCFNPFSTSVVCNADGDNKINEDEFEWPFRVTDTIVSSPALSDISNNGVPDIIIGSDWSGALPLKGDRKNVITDTDTPGASTNLHGGIIRAIASSGQEIGKFPRWIEQVVWSSPAVADINGDGKKEIFVGTGFVFEDSGGFKGKGIYAYNSDGTAFLPGKSPYGLFAATNDAIFASPAIGDINGDGHLEIVAADFSGYVYAWDRNGNILPGFPMLPLQEFAASIGDQSAAHQQIRSSPILADVDGDGKPEIILGVGWSIVAIKGDGTLVPAFRYGHTNFTCGTTSVFAPPAAADLDNNGKIDLVWATGKSSNGGSTVDNGEIHIWELGAFDKQANPWPMFKRTGTRTSSLDLHLENPIFSPFFNAADEGNVLTVSVEVYPGISPVAAVELSIDINSSTLKIPLSDDGTGGDSVAGDGRYSGTVNLPALITSVGNMYFTATATNSETVSLKVPAAFKLILSKNLVRKYYVDVLDRAAEAGGAESWTAEIMRLDSLGIDPTEGLVALARVIFNSSEYLQRNTTNAEYVNDLYLTFLNRSPDASGAAFWEGYLDPPNNLPRSVLLNSFAYSAEFSLYIENIFGDSSRRPENDLVNDFYRGFLGRLPDSGGFDGWLGMMRTAQCSSSQAVRDLSNAIALGFIQSSEYALRNRTNQQFLEDLYDGILRRGATPAEFSSWTTFWHNNPSYTRAQILSLFTNSAEFQLRVQEIIDAGCYQ